MIHMQLTRCEGAKGMETNNRYRRSDLFLVRLWAGHASDGGGRGQAEWRGRVQRVVDGEAREFSSLQGLVDALLTMLSSDERR